MYQDGKPKVYKIIIAGNGGIGKTTLLRVFCGEKFNQHENLTIGTSFFTKKAQINSKRKVILQLWDLGGQQQFRTIIDSFMNGSIGVLLGFGANRRNSFRDLKYWLSFLKDCAPEVPIVLIAMKSDLGYDSTLNNKIVKEFVKKHDNIYSFIKTSSKLGKNIQEPFRDLIEAIDKTKPHKIKDIVFLKTHQ